MQLIIKAPTASRSHRHKPGTATHRARHRRRLRVVYEDDETETDVLDEETQVEETRVVSGGTEGSRAEQREVLSRHIVFPPESNHRAHPLRDRYDFGESMPVGMTEIDGLVPYGEAGDFRTDRFHRTYANRSFCDGERLQQTTSRSLRWHDVRKPFCRENIDDELHAIESLHARQLSIRRQVLQERRGSTGSVLRQRGILDPHASVYPTSRGPVVSDLQRDRERTRLAWSDYLNLLPSDYFSPRLLFHSRQDQGAVFRTDSSRYRALFVSALAMNENNNLDLRLIYSQRCENRLNRGMSVGGYKNLRSVLGQYCRVYLTFEPDRRENFFEQGNLFRALRNFRLLSLYLDKYRVDAAPSTVAAKANQLAAAAKIARTFYKSQNRLREQGEISMILSHLYSISSTFKMEGRTQRRLKNTVEEKLSSGRLLLREDFEQCIMFAERRLLETMENLQHKVSFPAPLSRLRRFQSTLNKWFINFSALLMFLAGGQRPQVYCHLMAPDEAYLVEIERDPFQDYIELEVISEKVVRSHTMPNVLLPKRVIRYLFFHINYMLPWVMVIHGSELSRAHQRLLRNTRTGNALNSSQVARTLRLFMETYDPELASVTPMAIRGSYATMMIQKYLRGEVFSQKSESNFLEFLAKAMNTSKEQLDATYAAAKTQDFQDVANELVSGLIQEEIDESRRIHESEWKRSTN